MDKKNKKFWENGIQFECQMSGKCCQSRGQYGYVYLNDQDQKTMANHFNLNLGEFLDQYCDEEEGWIFLKHPEQDCQFLMNHQCMVYEARPIQCRTWPFWKENMTQKVWSQEVISFCPGVGIGRVYSKNEIKTLLKKNDT